MDNAPLRLILAGLLLCAASVQAALSVTARGTTANATAQTSLAVSPTSNMTAGSNILGVLVVAMDNSASGGACCAISTTSVADTAGNTWTRRLNAVYDPGAANAGVEIALFTAPLPNGLTTGGSVTISFSSTTAKCFGFWEVASAGGTTVSQIDAAVECNNCTSGNTGTTQTVTTANSLNVGDVVIGMVGIEGNPTITADSDTTNGNWSSAQTAQGGTGMAMSTQNKVQTTTTSTQTYNTSTGSSLDWNNFYIQLRESSTSIKTVMDLANASVKTVQDLARASVKTIMDLP